SAIAPSHAQRSSSVSGMPACIFSTLAVGWNQSPSSNSQPSRAASNAPIVDFPDPETPMMTMPAGAADDAARDAPASIEVIAPLQASGAAYVFVRSDDRSCSSSSPMVASSTSACGYLATSPGSHA